MTQVSVIVLAAALFFARGQDVTPRDLEVINAALDHRARAASRGPVMLLFDRTLRACRKGEPSFSCIPGDDQHLEFTQKQISELTPEWMEALTQRNAVEHLLASSVADDVRLIPRDKLREAMARYNATVYAFTSLPVYRDDETAVMYLGFFCGGLCGEGNFILLRRVAGRWKVEKAAMTWIS